MDSIMECNYWMEIFANFRKGAVLNEVIKTKEPFIREPRWISPIYADDCRLYRAFDLDGFAHKEDFPLQGQEPIWDGICKDEASRKYLFVHTVDSPKELMGASPDTMTEGDREGFLRAARMLNLSGNIENWFRDYYPLAKELSYVALLSDPTGRHMERGYRCELVLLSLVGNYRNVETTREEWEAFYQRLGEEMFGDRGMPFFVVPVCFEV